MIKLLEYYVTVYIEKSRDFTNAVELPSPVDSPQIYRFSTDQIFEWNLLSFSLLRFLWNCVSCVKILMGCQAFFLLFAVVVFVFVGSYVTNRISILVFYIFDPELIFFFQNITSSEYLIIAFEILRTFSLLDESKLNTTLFLCFLYSW